MDDIKKDYTELHSLNNKNYNSTNAESIEKIIKAINENLEEMRYIRNQLNTENNLSSDALIKKNQLLKMENEELQEQLRELENIQSTISNKDTIIDQLNKNTEEYNSNIVILYICLFLAIILFIKTLLYVRGLVPFKIFLYLFVYVMLCYFFIFMYYFNIFYFYDAIMYLRMYKERAIENKLKKWSDKKGDGKNNDKWVEENCNCPTEEENHGGNPNDEEGIYSENDGLNSGGELPGYFYYDGSAPQQLIQPIPTEEYVKMNETIEWVDYSNDGNPKYNHRKNNTIYDNKQFYNYKSNKDPEIIKRKKEERANYLVNNKTITTNL